MGVRRFGTGPPLVALHGFTLTGEQFAPADSMLGRTIIAPDLPGHGRSTDSPTGLVDVIGFIASVITSASAAVPLIGYSQGARLALMAAIEQSESISALVLVSANAGIEDGAERAARRRSDADLASRLTAMTIDEIVDTWTSTGITSTTHLSDKERAADRAIRRQNSGRGLANAVTGYGQGTQPSVWDRIGGLTMPVLVMCGIRDEKYSTIARRLADLIPSAELVIIDDAGHNPLADSPERAYGAVSDFLHRNC